MKQWMTLACVLLATALAGCQHMGFLAYVFSPHGDKQVVDAQFKDLPGKKIAIVIYADDSVTYENPYIRLESSLAVAAELRKHVKNVTLVDARVIARYQDENLQWEAMDKTQLGKAFEADYVLYISLLEFATREPGSVNLLRGHIVSQVDVYRTTLPERQARVYATEISVTWPKDMAVGAAGEGDQKIRQGVLAEFSKTLVEKFYSHEVAP